MVIVIALIVGIWIAIAALAQAGVAIIYLVMHPTLRRYGIDPDSRGWIHASSWMWVSKYKQICVEEGLSLRYWRLFIGGIAISKCLGLIWVALVAWVFWHDIVRQVLPASM